MKDLIAFLLLMAGGTTIFSCSPKTDLEGFDEAAWKEDTGGCSGKRVELSESIPGIKEDLMGMGQKEIQSVLGKPDRHELSRRNRKYFIYYIEAGPACPATSDASPRSLWVGFDALGRTNEVVFQQN
ncbi:hypothetical protein AB9P05_18250 [Roseivirga sp. BDSF3-8]|uniref:hypothetical protein n=1 Tax=Roseivirga sp. BDSF3-8 TaxID=3241598 RepID=UPI0035322FA4